ncbi:MAG TPA: hypothetical protein VJH91_01085 [Candidatus Paceibacterota bacterium]
MSFGIRCTISAAFAVAIFFAGSGIAAAQMTPEQRAQLERELASIEADIQKNQAELSKKRQERTSLERDVAILETKIRAEQLAIKQRDLTIQKLRNEISDKQHGITTLNIKYSESQESLAQILRRTREIDDTSLVERALGKSISELFQDIDDFEQVQRALDSSFTVIVNTRDNLSARKQALEEQQVDESQLRQLQVLQRQSLEKIERDKQELVRLAKGQEANYQKVISEKQKTAAEIRARLFDLRDSGAIPFGTAYNYAKEASAKTGVRSAVILAVLRQETNLGENVGQCLLTNSPNKGDGKGKNTGRAFSQVMKGSRDVDPFIQITSELGLDPFSQVVSCPQSGGFGGAMGPAQFIPSTWMLYKDRLANVTGQPIPNPWSARTAIFATALLMADNGADSGTAASERLAALRYFAGWGNANKSAYRFYGDGVMNFAAEYQADIDVLEGR